jgi:hypothetical protein
LIFRDTDVGMDLEGLTSGWPEIDMGEVFRCRYQFSGQSGAIRFQFYRATWWYATFFREAPAL